jgi:sarcosine oxidase
MNAFDAAVIGLGTMGTFACLELARRNVSVIGLDRFEPPHDRGSHTGATRVFRTAYAEHPDYVPLALRAGLLWEQLGAEAGRTLLHRTGMLSLGPPESALLCGVRASAAAHNLVVEELSERQVRSRFPGFELMAGWEALFEPAAGWIDVDAAMRFGLERAAHSGAELRLNTPVERWEWKSGGFVVITAAGSFTAKRLIITAGAWANRLISDLALPLRVIRKALVWVNPVRPELFRPDRFPVFASARHFFYGFPQIGGTGVKLGIHSNQGATAVDPDVNRPEPGFDDVRPVLETAAELMPSLAGSLPDALNRVLRTKSCFYTMTPDEHFVIDRHPEFENLILAAGFSGHGFKFAPVIGEALADLALTGRSTLPVGFLGLSRLLTSSLK